MSGLKHIVFSFIVCLLPGCANIDIDGAYNDVDIFGAETNILNSVDISINNKKLLRLKGAHHVDPNLKKDLIRQEYFFTTDF